MIIDVAAPRYCGIDKQVRKLSLTAETPEEAIRLRNLYRAIVGEVRFQYIDENGDILTEEDLDGE